MTRFIRKCFWQLLTYHKKAGIPGSHPEMLGMTDEHQRLPVIQVNCSNCPVQHFFFFCAARFLDPHGSQKEVVWLAVTISCCRCVSSLCFIVGISASFPHVF